MVDTATIDVITETTRNLTLEQARGQPFDYKWIIKNPRDQERMGGLYLSHSPQFQALSAEQAWKLVCYQGNTGEEHTMTVALVRTQPDDAGVQYVDYDCKVWDQDERHLNASYGCASVRGNHLVSLVDFPRHSWEISKAIVIQLKLWRKSVNADYFQPQRKTYLHDGTDDCRGEQQHAVKNLSLDMGEALLSGMFSDVTLVVEGRRFKAHRFVLAARSPVFARMFLSNMRESRDQEIQIPTANRDCFRKFLQFCYTDAVQNVELDAIGLLLLADHYDVPGLRWVCEKCLLAVMCPENALDIMLVADLINDAMLLTKTMEYIKPRQEAVYKTVRHDELMATKATQLLRMKWMVEHHEIEEPKEEEEAAAAEGKEFREVLV
ncbi:kelch-like protein 40 [Trichogramma pretiosum]|uniref:kelch-like protein 40 n=1 Tax=Trichogramma pretiosum TaxID=7493 RepID=UPI0006C9C4C0|nr:kelch-like protein 40 [Trichogramma pretiosum]